MWPFLFVASGFPITWGQRSEISLPAPAGTLIVEHDRTLHLLTLGVMHTCRLQCWACCIPLMHLLSVWSNMQVWT